MKNAIELIVPQSHQVLWSLLSHIKVGQAIQYGILNFGKSNGNPFNLIFDDPQQSQGTRDKMNALSMKLIQDLRKNGHLQCTSRPSGTMRYDVYAIAPTYKHEVKPPI